MRFIQRGEKVLNLPYQPGFLPGDVPFTGFRALFGSLCTLIYPNYTPFSFAPQYIIQFIRNFDPVNILTFSRDLRYANRCKDKNLQGVETLVQREYSRLCPVLLV